MGSCSIAALLERGLLQTLDAFFCANLSHESLPLSKPKPNLSKIKALVVDSDADSPSIVVEILRGFGMDMPAVATTGAEAKQLLATNQYDLCITEAVLSDMKAPELVSWMRRNVPAPVQYAPVIVLTGFTQAGMVTALRDSGVNTVVKKPASPGVLFDHIACITEQARPFIEAPGYVGPDRRYKFTGPPDGFGRRSTDLDAEVGAATEPNMSQDEIDSLMKPMKLDI